MMEVAQIKEHMTVVGSDGGHVGTVDHLDGGSMIKLTKSDEAAQGQHHWIPVDWVQSVDAAVKLSKPASDACSQWSMQGPSGSM